MGLRSRRIGRSLRSARLAACPRFAQFRGVFSLTPQSTANRSSVAGTANFLFLRNLESKPFVFKDLAEIGNVHLAKNKGVIPGDRQGERGVGSLWYTARRAITSTLLDRQLLTASLRVVLKTSFQRDAKRERHPERGLEPRRVLVLPHGNHCLARHASMLARRVDIQDRRPSTGFRPSRLPN